MTTYAIVQASGKQFWVEENRFYDFDKLPLNPGDTFKLKQACSAPACAFSWNGVLRPVGMARFRWAPKSLPWALRWPRMTLGLGNKKHVGTGNSTTLNETIMMCGLILVLSIPSLLTCPWSRPWLTFELDIGRLEIRLALPGCRRHVTARVHRGGVPCPGTCALHCRSALQPQVGKGKRSKSKRKEREKWRRWRCRYERERIIASLDSPTKNYQQRNAWNPKSNLPMPAYRVEKRHTSYTKSSRVADIILPLPIPL